MEIITNLLSTNDRKFKVFYLINLILIKLIFIVCIKQRIYYLKIRNLVFN